MAEFGLRQSNTQTAGEKVLGNSGVRGLISSDLPASEVIGTLTKRVRVAKTKTEKWNYILPAIFAKNLVFDGMLDVNYTELQTGDSTNPYADGALGDFSAPTNKAIRMTYHAVTQSNVKTKILSNVLMNFKTSPNDGIQAVYESSAQVNKSQSLFWAQQLWTALVEKSVIVDTTDKEDVASSGESVNKLIYTTLKKYGTTKKAHLGVGNGSEPGVITDAAGNSVKPSMSFDSSEFYIVQSVDFQANTIYDGEKTFFNWNSSSYEIAGVYTLDITDAEEVPAEVITQLQTFKAILIHKDALYGIQDWEGTGIANSGKLYNVIHNYMKQDVVPIYDSPIVVFMDETTEASPAKQKVQNKKVVVETNDQEEDIETINLDADPDDIEEINIPQEDKKGKK